VANKATFKPDEWKQVVGGVFMAGFAITAADPSGLWGLLKETVASGKALLEAKTTPTGNELIKAIVSDFETADGRTAGRDYVKSRMEGAKREELKTRAVEAVRQAAKIVEAKAPTDASAYKEWLMHISQKVAEASKEGGFLGFGGVAVSDAEKATLSEIQSALGR
jgi:hypothetical protein